MAKLVHYMNGSPIKDMPRLRVADNIPDMQVGDVITMDPCTETKLAYRVVDKVHSPIVERGSVIKYEVVYLVSVNWWKRAYD
jgi:hypothetical protein